MQGYPRRNRSQIPPIRSIVGPLQAPTSPPPRRLLRKHRPSRTQICRLDLTDLHRKVRLSLHTSTETGAPTHIKPQNIPDTSSAVDADSPCAKSTAKSSKAPSWPPTPTTPSTASSSTTLYSTTAKISTCSRLPISAKTSRASATAISSTCSRIFGSWTVSGGCRRVFCHVRRWP